MTVFARRARWSVGCSSAKNSVRHGHLDCLSTALVSGRQISSQKRRDAEEASKAPRLIRDDLLEEGAVHYDRLGLTMLVIVLLCVVVGRSIDMLCDRLAELLRGFIDACRTVHHSNAVLIDACTKHH